VKRIGQRYQRTLQRTVEVVGTGFVTGAQVRLRFRPAAANQGITFTRADLPGTPSIAAHGRNVTGTKRRTILGQPPAQVELVEHVLAALCGLQIDNCTVEVDAPEPPGMDGSAGPFVTALRSAGLAMQFVRRDVWTAEEPITVTDGLATLTLYPSATPGLRVTYLLDYGQQAPIAPQRYVADVTPARFAGDVARARTFLLLEEAEVLRQQGIGANTGLRDLVVFGPRGPLENRLRWADEPARHKLLDVVGDLGLFGQDLAGHVVAYRSGHALNVALVQRLLENLRERQPARRQAA
jgi:UDP-3-O-acyl N-acetylglucosamine deacetylase